MKASAAQLPIAPGGRIGGGPLLAYGALGLPLAFAALPIYVHVPKLYGDAFGLSLTVVGVVLLAIRLLDALADPLMGWWSDRLGQRRILIAAALPFLALGMLGLFDPPASWIGPAWLALTLTLVYLGFSLASVNYYAWGAELSTAGHERTRIVASREGFALVGVVSPPIWAATWRTGWRTWHCSSCPSSRWRQPSPWWRRRSSPRERRIARASRRRCG